MASATMALALVATIACCLAFLRVQQQVIQYTQGEMSKLRFSDAHISILNMIDTVEADYSLSLWQLKPPTPATSTAAEYLGAQLNGGALMDFMYGTHDNDTKQGRADALREQVSDYIEMFEDIDRGVGVNVHAYDENIVSLSIRGSVTHNWQLSGGQTRKLSTKTYGSSD